MRSPLPLIPLLIGALALVSCAASPAVAPSVDQTPSGHGHIDGAQETDEPPVHVATIAADGTAAQLDLVSEEWAPLGEIGAPTSLHSDGRYLFAGIDGGVEIIDSGMWTWDHVDHFHYYRAESRVIGTVPDADAATVATSNSSTTGGAGVYVPATGDAVLLDVAALSRGELVESFRLQTTPHAGLVVPVGSFALVTDADGTVAVFDSTGTEVADTRTDCAEPAGTVTTRVGAVLGCADAALLAHVADGTVSLEHIPLPEGVSRPASFANREGRPTAAGLAADGSIVLLNTRERSWRRLSAPEPLVAVTAVDDADQTVVALAADGSVIVLDGTTGALRARTEPLVAASLAAGARPVLMADDRRTYLSGVAERTVFEIDVADGARIARTFPTADEPAFAAETGR